MQAMPDPKDILTSVSHTLMEEENASRENPMPGGMSTQRARVRGADGGLPHRDSTAGASRHRLLSLGLATVMTLLVGSARGQDSSTPAQGQDSSTPSRGQDSSTPARGQDSTTPSRGQDSSTPARGQDSSTPARADSGAAAAGVEGTIAGLESDVKKLKAVKISGYVQARFELDETSLPGVKESDGKSTTNLDGFSIRRGRLKATWSKGPARALLQVDATGKGVSLKDAEVSCALPLQTVKLTLTAGQMKVPFGYELLLSSSSRELPERAVMVRALFPGERDRGIKLSASYQMVDLELGVFNGNGIEDTATKVRYYTDTNGNGILDPDEADAGTTDGNTLNYGHIDRDSMKDIAGRLGVEFGPITLGLSGYFGQWGTFDQALKTVDEEGEPITLGTNTPTYIPKTRLGADLQLALTLVEALGKTALRGELISAHGVFEKAAEDDVDALGYSVTFVQDLGSKLAVAARYDAFSTDTSDEADVSIALEPALLYSPTDATRLTLAYQLKRDNAGADGTDSGKADNHLTLQLQGSF